jgi:hypothetical protein
VLGPLVVATKPDYATELSFIHPDEYDTQLDYEAATQIYAYFSGRCDLSVTYDDDSEDAIAANAAFLNAREELRNATRITYRVGEMTTAERPNPLADPARDRVRVIRLSLFIDRMIEWNND